MKSFIHSSIFKIQHLKLPAALAAGVFLLAATTGHAQEIPARSSAEAQVPSETVHRVILIGDAGKLVDGQSPVPEAAAGTISPDDTSTTVVFLGDNIYPLGLPDEEEPGYEVSIAILQQQIKAFEHTESRLFFIPGNHDWQKSGPEGWERIRRQGTWIAGLEDERISFLPENGCPGPVTVPLSEQIVLVILDTQWWLHPFEKPGLESDCECKNEEEVLVALHDIAYRNRHKKIILTSHHAFRSYGIHGGYYTFMEHIFPFRDLNKGLYIPLPVIGSIYPLSRGVFGDIQDLKHPAYKHMVKSVEDAMSVAPDITWAAGHDHNLQLIRDQEQYYVVSGSGVNMERVKQGKNSLFASSRSGFAEIFFLKDGTKEIRFYEVDEKGEARPAFQHRVPAPPPVREAETEQTAGPDTKLAADALHADTVTAAIAPGYDKMGKGHRFFFGENYRKLWATPVPMKVFRMNEEKGGFSVLKRGGGMQTRSLHLLDSTGKRWKLRSIQKYPEKALPENLRVPVAQNIIQDQISAAHPFGFFTVPVLSEAIDVPYARPELFYIPDDPALGEYRKDFAGTVGELEEHEPVPGETWSTPDLLEEREEDIDQMVDQKALLKARLLDLLIGDWDRHEDQWRWGRREVDEGELYYPIPRDRDQVFFTNSGVIPWIGSRKWAMPKFQGFKAHIRDVNGFMFNARYFDRWFLQELDEEDWREAAAGVQEAMTDKVFTEALRQMPDTIYALSGEEILRILKSRREALQEEALKYYRFLAKEVDVTGSDKNERFEISRHADGSMRVQVSKISEGKHAGTIYYDRTFRPEVTKEVRLYGKGDEDVFHVSGSGRSPIKLRMIGGGKEDVFRIDPQVRDRKKLIVYDRSDKKNRFPDRARARLKTAPDKKVNDYNPTSFQYDVVMPLLTGGYNLDDGVLLGAGLMYTAHGFRKEPYASRNLFLLSHAVATEAWRLRYNGEFKQLIGKMDLEVDLDMRAPNNVANFFGEGNETVFIREGRQPVRYYRTRFNLMDLDVKLRYPVSNTVNVFAGPAGQYFNMDRDDNEGRFILDYENQYPGEMLFDEKMFAGFTAGLEIDTRDHELIPTRGMYWYTALKGMGGLGKVEEGYGQVHSEMSLFTSFSLNPRLVIANRIGGGHSLGSPEFFQLLYLGGTGNLLGYRSYRFGGRSMLYHNIELRLKLFDFTSYLFPGSVGLTGFHDVGRVWAKHETSDKWHNGYGGGLYVIPAGMVVINGMLGFSEEETLPYISVGFRF